jgi:small-conductance mechanosensitive channel
MTTPPISPVPEGEVRSRVLDKARFAVLVVLAALLVVCMAFAWITRGAMSSLSFLNQNGKAGSSAGIQKALVDLRPWQTAQALAAQAVTAEEIEYSRDAERLADHEVDQAFASALRQANQTAQNRKFTGDAVALSQRVDQLKQIVAQDQAQVDSLTPSSGKSKAGTQPAANSDELDIAKAQLGLDSDELDDAQDDLERASGDNRSEIQAELAAHEASMRKYDSEVHGVGDVAVISAARQGTLAGRLREWFKQRSRYNLIQQALTQTLDDIHNLTAEHNTLEAQANTHTGTNAVDRSSVLASLKARSAERQLLSIYDDRIKTEQQLAAVYQKWSAQVLLQHRILVHLILQSLALILFILMCMVLGDAFVVRLMAIPVLGHRQMHTLRSIIELSIQLLGVLLILFVLFGTPQQMPTILGLATAGITIVLQDFILAFFGWFVLMGKNGIHVGDRVEINGVGGEVVEIGLFHTTLLETGNLADLGLPTGRRITFNNSFTIRGQYFNFSTTGQWMWDEITVSLPASADARPIVERIQEAVQKETADGAAIAVQEWKGSSHSGHLSRLSTAPVVSLLTTAAGFDIQIRYVTRASSRFETRIALYQRVFDAIQDRNVAAKAAQLSAGNK